MKLPNLDSFLIFKSLFVEFEKIFISIDYLRWAKWLLITITYLPLYLAICLGDFIYQNFLLTPFWKHSTYFESSPVCIFVDVKNPFILKLSPIFVTCRKCKGLIFSRDNNFIILPAMLILFEHIDTSARQHKANLTFCLKIGLIANYRIKLFPNEFFWRGNQFDKYSLKVNTFGMNMNLWSKY